VRDTLGLQVCAIAKLTDLLQYLDTLSTPESAQHRSRVQAYRDRYGVT
jgi:orotate phosphoribosyltransferase